MMRKFKFDKIIRNKSLEDIKQINGVKVEEKALSTEEYCQELLKKLTEEANEVATAKNKNELTLELADVLEVVEAIAKSKNIPMKNIELTKKEKASKKGNFCEKTKILWVAVIDESNPNPKTQQFLKYGIENPDKYPEIK